VDLMAAAKSVGRPTRDNCGWCHFNGGGGNAVKHGDLDGSLAKPVERIDVHMGRHDFQCIECHRTVKHRIGGRMVATAATNAPEVACTDCHSPAPHRVDRLNEHSGAVSCQTCHIPRVALREPTKVAWDWSTAGRDVAVDDPHQYLKIKGSFLYEKDLLPWYRWYNGDVSRYLKGDKLDPEAVTLINDPQGGIRDPRARIHPFKIHRGKQPYDKEYDHLLVVKTAGEGGYWTEFDWDKAARLGAEASGVPYSGKMGFAETDMYWSLNHMVAPKNKALQCTDCHGEGTRMDWKALGYDEDPAFTGGRGHRRLVPAGKGDES
jgi:octaheme c-type cytochrome (tetrathionate reductase family)